MPSHERLALSGWLGVCVALAVLACTQAHAAKAGPRAPSGKNRDLVVLEHERWLDTLKGTIKNFSKAPARDVTVVVKFLDRKRKLLGTQRVTVGELASGDQGSWSLPIQEKNRPATSYQFEVHAIWQ